MERKIFGRKRTVWVPLTVITYHHRTCENNNRSLVKNVMKLRQLLLEMFLLRFRGHLLFFSWNFYVLGTNYFAGNIVQTETVLSQVKLSGCF